MTEIDELEATCLCPEPRTEYYDNLVFNIGKNQIGYCMVHRRLWFEAYGYGVYNYDLDSVRHNFYDFDGFTPNGYTAPWWDRLRFLFAAEHFGLVDLEGAVERELLYHLETPEGH